MSTRLPLGWNQVLAHLPPVQAPQNQPMRSCERAMAGILVPMNTALEELLPADVAHSPNRQVAHILAPSLGDNELSADSCGIGYASR